MFNYFPLTYLFASRLVTKAEKLSWVIIYPFFLLFVVYLFNGDVLHYIIVFFGVMAVYEVGYLYNDFVTVKKEVSPTFRDVDTKGFSEKSFLHLRNSRLLVAILLSMLEFFLFGSIYLLLFSFAILITYYFHNTVRSRLNVVTYSFLVSERYIAPVSFILDLKLFIFILFSFPIVRTIEHACKKKYNFTWVQQVVGNPDKFRVIYYFFALAIALCFYYFSTFGLSYILMIFYFFLFRVMSYLVRNKVKRQKHGAYEK